MIDRELLEMAAKAAGIPVEWDGDGFVRPVPFKGFTNYEPWNPLTADGDALRLAVKLGIEVHPDREVSEVVTAFCVHRPNLIGLNTYEEFGNDEMAATRRAIVRAAAEIGKAMP